MIVGKIWDSEYPWDVRVEKVCHSLVQSGHQVELVCRNRRREALVESCDGLTIHRMPVAKALPKALERASSFPAFVNPRWYFHTLRTFRDRRAELIVCRDLPLAPMALAVGHSLSIPVIIDVAEHYPGLLRDLYNREDFRLINLLVRNPALAALVERLSLPRAAGVWVVVEEMAARLKGLGVPGSRITLVSNTPLPSRAALMAQRPRVSSPANQLRLVYLGNVERSRGLGVVIEAIGLMRQEPLRVTLDVFGDGTSLDQDRRQARELGVSDRIVFHGRMPYEDILSRLPEYDVGVIPHHATDHWNYTIQNKLFDYMAAGLATIVSSMPPAARIVRETGAGLVFSDRDTGSLREAILRLGVPGEASAFGVRGQTAVRTRYNWSHDAARMVASLDAVLRSARPGRLGPRAEEGSNPSISAPAGSK